MARIPLAYPKIPGSGDAPLARCIAFEKYDGSNLHWVWTKSLGWYAFGMRRSRFPLDPLGIQQFAQQHQECHEAPELFLTHWAESLAERFGRQPELWGNEVTAFTEFLGPNSFAGKHRAEDSKELILFDLETKDGILPPERFVAEFDSMNSARVVYQGKLTGKFAEDVREGKYHVNEGVVRKGRAGDQVWMAKIKTYEYLERLKQAFGSGWESFWE